MQRPQEEIEFEEDPYRQQLERTLEILETEVTKKQVVSEELRKIAAEHSLLQQNCIEQRNVITDLKQQLNTLLSKGSNDVCLATEETNAHIQEALDLLRPFREKYQDLYPHLSKLVVQDTLAKSETEYDRDTLAKVTIEAKTIDLDHTISSDKSLGDSKLSKISSSSDVIDSSPSEPLQPKKSSGWGFFNPFSGTSELKPQQTIDQKMEKPSKFKEWTTIFEKLSKGESVWSLSSKMDSLFRAGSFIPQEYRGFIWSRLIGNRSRVTPRIYNMLLLQIPQANPIAKECILKDVERTFVQYSNSETFQTIKHDVRKIMQLFEVVLS